MVERPTIATFTHILVGTDGSAGAREAVRQGARFAALFDARMDVAHVFDLDRPTLAGEPTDRRARAESMLDDAARVARAAGVVPSTRLLAGGRAPSLVHDAREHRVDLISVGQDAGFFEHLHLRRGVAAQTVREAPCSVLVARPKQVEAQATEASGPERVLCATDGSAASTEAVRQAAAIAASAGAELTILHVVPVFEGEGVWAANDDQQGYEPLAPAVELSRSFGVEPRREMAMGRPGESIVQAADEWNADLVVVGSHGRHGLPRVLLGSVSEWVAGHAPCSVLVARPRSA